MPIKVNSGETHDEFIGRCMSEESTSFPDTPQRYAVCESIYRKQEMSKLRTSQEKFSAKLKYSQDFRGINLTNFGENSDACWDDYIQVGTKIVDGREVPDCRGPIEEMKEGVPHYTKDGELYTGPTHKDASGRLMTGDTHTETSEYLYHREDLEVQPMVDSSYPGEGAKTGSI